LCSKLRDNLLLLKLPWCSKLRDKMPLVKSHWCSQLRNNLLLLKLPQRSKLEPMVCFWRVQGCYRGHMCFPRSRPLQEQARGKLSRAGQVRQCGARCTL
jgi:hypothetical protein